MLKYQDPEQALPAIVFSCSAPLIPSVLLPDPVVFIFYAREVLDRIRHLSGSFFWIDVGSGPFASFSLFCFDCTTLHQSSH
jgi:hypothetical protein